jgi:hypothetical protein
LRQNFLPLQQSIRFPKRELYNFESEGKHIHIPAINKEQLEYGKVMHTNSRLSGQDGTEFT